jgi:hypothetical protein
MRLTYPRGIAGPAWAQALSFGAVVVAGLVLGHGVALPNVVHRATAGQGKTGQQQGTVPQQAGGTRLTITAVAQPGTSAITSAGHALAGQFQSARVAVLAAGSLRPAASGRLGPAGTLVVHLPVGAYAVCLLPPRQWRPAGATATGPAGWACTDITVGTHPGQAKLKFAAAAPKRAGEQEPAAGQQAGGDRKSGPDQKAGRDQKAGGDQK